MHRSTLDRKPWPPNCRPASSLPPVELWNPPLSGDMDLRIARDGVWSHEDEPIQRGALVRLFASILRYDPDGHYYLLRRWKMAHSSR